jgi:hypothetical protein
VVNRDDRQQQLYAWACAAFGVGEVDNLPQRALRLLEECVEAFQACGGDREMAHKLVDFVFERPVGELHQEIGGISVCLLVLAQAACMSAEREEVTEISDRQFKAGDGSVFWIECPMSDARVERVSS